MDVSTQADRLLRLPQRIEVPIFTRFDRRVAVVLEAACGHDLHLHEESGTRHESMREDLLDDPRNERCGCVVREGVSANQDGSTSSFFLRWGRNAWAAWAAWEVLLFELHIDPSLSPGDRDTSMAHGNWWDLPVQENEGIQTLYYLDPPRGVQWTTPHYL